MEGRDDGHAVHGSGSKTVVAVDIDPKLLEELDELPDVRIGLRQYQWTAAQDEVLRRYWAKKRKADVARKLGLGEDICRRRYRELMGG